MRTGFVVAAATLLVLSGWAARGGPASAPASAARAELAGRVRQELLHAWRGYERNAWGQDELKPVSKTAKDWYGDSLLMTPVDTLDTLILMGLKDEAEKAKALILEKLSFDKDISVKNFEVTIRLLGGLLSGYQMTGDQRLLRLAEDLGTRLLPVFDSPTGMPYMYVNLKTGKTKRSPSNPAEIGTLVLEFGTLAKLTGKPVFYERDAASGLGVAGTVEGAIPAERVDQDVRVEQEHGAQGRYRTLRRRARCFDVSCSRSLCRASFFKAFGGNGKPFPAAKVGSSISSGFRGAPASRSFKRRASSMKLVTVVPCRAAADLVSR
jgi:hypothetical protein